MARSGVQFWCVFNYDEDVPELNGKAHSLLEERIARALREYGVDVRSGPEGSGSDLLVAVPTSEGDRHLTVDVKAIPRGSVNRRHRTGDIAAHEYVSPPMAANYRSQDRFYIDAQGNAYIALPGFRVDVQGRRPPKPSGSGTLKPRHAFGHAGAKLVFAMLVAPNVMGGTVREMSNLSGVATGTVTNTIQDLEENGFLTTTSGRRRLRRTAQLTDLWVSSYLTRILPKLEEASLSGPDPRWWGRTDLPADARLGGGAALATMGLDVLPEAALIYGQPPWVELRKVGRLGREGVPNVTLRERFWSPELDPSPALVPPLLVYADAMASDDPRQIEAAEELWETNDDLRRLRTGD